jgi:hypothetical protein
MSAPENKPSLYTDLPSGISQSSVKAMANALGLNLAAMEKNLFNPVAELGAKFQLLAEAKPNAFFLIDLGRLLTRGLNIIQLHHLIKSADLRGRIFLCHSESQISIGTRQFVKTLGFAELVADIDPRDGLGALQSFTDWMVRRAPSLSSRIGRLPAFLKTVPLTGGNEPSRALVQRMTARSAELLTVDMVKHLDVRERTYHLKVYPDCFLGNEACKYLQQKFKLVEAQAIALGQALQRLGLIYHVAHEQNFANEGLFFRFAISKEVEKIPALDAWNSLGTSLEIKDRSYLGKDYPKSFIGSEAVSRISEHWSLSRHDAMTLMHRFELLGLVEHVTQEHPFIDGPFYYRLMA